MIAAIALGLTVSAAVSLEAPLEEIGASWERHGHARIALNAAASGLLLAQIERGAPVDVYMSASPREIDRLAKAGAIVAGSRRTVAGNRLVAIVPKGGKAPIAIADLASDLYDRIAIGNPETVPAGRYARGALEVAGIWERVRPRLVFAENVRQVLDWVARGEAAAGIVYRTDVALARGAVVAGAEAPAGSHAPIVYEGCAIAGEREEEAKAFLEFLGSREGAAIFARHGFEPPGR